MGRKGREQQKTRMRPQETWPRSRQSEKGGHQSKLNTTSKKGENRNRENIGISVLSVGLFLQCSLGSVYNELRRGMARRIQFEKIGNKETISKIYIKNLYYNKEPVSPA